MTAQMPGLHTKLLDYHYFDTTLPHPLSSIIHQLPGWFDWLSLNFMYLIEIVLPLRFFTNSLQTHCPIGAGHSTSFHSLLPGITASLICSL